MKKLFIFMALAALLLTGCFSEEKQTVPETEKNAGIDKPVKIEPKPDIVDTALAKMSLEGKLWQLFFVTPEAVFGGEAVTNAEDCFGDGANQRPVGGIIIFGQNAVSRQQLTALLAAMTAEFKTPVFFGVDEEGGNVTRLSKNCGVTDNGHMSMVETPEEAAYIGRRLGAELSALGLNVDFAPVADVLLNPFNTEIGSRSYGSDPERVGEMVASQVIGMQSRGISAVLKHFPGHGSTEADSHKGISVSNRTLEQLRGCEFLPFKSGIEAGADFIMVSHMSLPEVTGDNTPCSLSGTIIDGLLRGELGFEGIIITDALNMGAVAEYDSAVMAVEAGADMLLMPSDLDEAHRGLLEAVESGRISEERIDQSVRRIMAVKHKLGLL